MAEDTDILVAPEHDHSDEDGHWEGGEAKPFDTSYGKLMMWYFLLSDAFTFAGFLIAYGTLRFSSISWPVPDKVFATAPFGIHNLGIFGGEAPLIFVTFMSFLLIISSGTMVRAVQEGALENKRGVVFWMFLTVLGGAGFLGCQAWEWNNLINHEHMTVTTNPFGSYTENGFFLDPETGEQTDEPVELGETYLLHVAGAEHGEAGEETFAYPETAGNYAGFEIMGDGTPYIRRKYMATDGPDAGSIKTQQFGPTAFGALFFGITGFHGFHVLTGVAFLLIILINSASGVYAMRANGYEMVEKIGLYWHFVDLVWVFVFLVFYLL
ncbi:cytochrome c oxidase subunit 3 [Neolewinella antarctica]|uniref:Cytochrome c oxidase subunit 3 n=1 Tax=Neolewinella antarctica TaxID=442734 RepID=A0ABX0X866_9BACT|nr:cytochrome c oxidase subunit 3 [Neolewinella antarctica]NJC25169.1 cytochrome c oxidase subunit 3 [Neolewinella antarctica]